MPVKRPTVSTTAAKGRVAPPAAGPHPERLAKPTAKRPELKHKEMDKLIRMCWDQGWWCLQGKKSHILVYAPGGVGSTTIPSTPSGSKTYRNKLSQLKRYGLRVDDHRTG